jgi:TorA maturation chaperone TorD
MEEATRTRPARRAEQGGDVSMSASQITDLKEAWLPFLTAELLTPALLGKLLFQYPDREWIQSLIDEDVFGEIPLDPSRPDIARGLDFLNGWCVNRRGAMTDADFQDLQVDYTRLFIGVDGVLAPPWESVHRSREHLLFQEQTIRVRQWYLQYGLQVIEQGKEPDDHVGLEMVFLSHLARQGLAALEEGDVERFDASLTAQRRFLAQHPLQWVPVWSAQVDQHAATDFYRGLGILTNGVLMALAERLDVELPQKLGT